jgi:hypothetical protein
VTDVTKLDKKTFADSLGVNAQSLGGMLTQMRNSSAKYEKLRSLDYTDVQIPSWVAGAEAGDGAGLKAELKAGLKAEAAGIAEEAPGVPCYRRLGQPASQPTSQPFDYPFDYPSGFTG